MVNGVAATTHSGFRFRHSGSAHQSESLLCGNSSGPAAERLKSSPKRARRHTTARSISFFAIPRSMRGTPSPWHERPRTAPHLGGRGDRARSATARPRRLCSPAIARKRICNPSYLPRDSPARFENPCPAPSAIRRFRLRVGHQFSPNHNVYFQGNEWEYPSYNQGVGGFVLPDAGFNSNQWERECGVRRPLGALSQVAESVPAPGRLGTSRHHQRQSRRRKSSFRMPLHPAARRSIAWIPNAISR